MLDSLVDHIHQSMQAADDDIRISHCAIDRDILHRAVTLALCGWEVR